MKKQQKSYTKEFKEQIVELHNKTGKSITKLSSEYGIPKGTISTWLRNMTPIKINEKEEITIKEYKELQKRIKELEEENEILKKATAIFARER